MITSSPGWANESNMGDAYSAVGYILENDGGVLQGYFHTRCRQLLSLVRWPVSPSSSAMRTILPDLHYGH